MFLNKAQIDNRSYQDDCMLYFFFFLYVLEEWKQLVISSFLLHIQWNCSFPQEWGSTWHVTAIFLTFSLQTYMSCVITSAMLLGIYLSLLWNTDCRETSSRHWSMHLHVTVFILLISGLQRYWLIFTVITAATLASCSEQIKACWVLTLALKPIMYFHFQCEFIFSIITQVNQIRFGTVHGVII